MIITFREVGGLCVARQLGHDPEVALIVDCRASHLFQPMRSNVGHGRPVAGPLHPAL